MQHTTLHTTAVQFTSYTHTQKHTRLTAFFPGQLG